MAAIDFGAIAQVLPSVTQCISDVSKVISENRTARAKIDLEGRKIDADLMIKLNERDTEMKIALAEHKAKIDQLSMQSKLREKEIKKEQKEIDNAHKAQMANIRQMGRIADKDHEARMASIETEYSVKMETLSVVRELMQYAYQYHQDGIQYGAEYYPVEAQSLMQQAMASLGAVTQTLLALPSGN